MSLAALKLASKSFSRQTIYSGVSLKLLIGAGLLTVAVPSHAQEFEATKTQTNKHVSLTSGQKLQWNYLQSLTKEFNNRENSDARSHSAKNYLQGSRGLKELFADNIDFWRGRARAALILDDKGAGLEAGMKLSALAENEESLKSLFLQLREKGWTEGSQARKNGDDFVVRSLDLQMVYIAAGSFMMGNPNNSLREANEGPLSHVTLSKSFWMGRYEITARQWKTVMREDTSETEHYRGNIPAVNITWEEAMEFCRKLNVFEQSRGALPVGFAYGLPTEAQWEYACRAGTGGAGELDENAWFAGNSGGQLHVIGEKKANRWGLAGMLGNASEWCFDWYADRLPGGKVVDPTGPARGETRVVRGGNFNSLPDQCLPSKRSGVNPEPLKGQGDKIGFRVVLAPILN